MDNKQDSAENIKKKKKKKKKFKTWKVVLLTFALVILVAIGAGCGIVLAFINTAPQIDMNDFTNLVQTSNIYDKDGNYIESLHGVENRTYVPLSKINKYTQNAFIAIEDERFREHGGVDIQRIFGALWADLRSGEAEQGASTLTQQLIKNRILGPEKSVKRKIQEAYLAIKLEDELSKDQILEYYLNTIWLGGSAYGVEAAAEYYFNKSVDQLDIAQSALIAGITQSPSKYNPYLDEDTPEVYKDRQLQVLSNMLENNFISKEEYEDAKNEKLEFSSKQDNASLKYQWFIEAAVGSIQTDLKAKYGYTNDEVTQMIYAGGLKIYTTVDPKVQEAAEAAANNDEFYPKLKGDIATYGKDKVIQPQIGIVIDDYKTGEVRAIVGGRGQFPLKSLDRAIDVPRQPGSSMKPLAVYGPAFDMGYSPGTVIDDTPLTPEMIAAAGWTGDGPQNFDRKFQGFCTLRDAIRQSKNIIAVKMMLKIGPSNSIEYLRRFGLQHLVITPDKNGNTDVVPAIALGGMTEGVTPLEMSAAYGAFGNGGVYTSPILYTKVLNSDGDVLLEKKPEKHQVLSAQAAYLTVSSLQTAVDSGTGNWAKSKSGFSNMPIAGKTGTTNLNADAYFTGLTPYYSGAVWMGHDKPSQSVSGMNSSETAWMWGAIMKQVHDGLAYKDFDKPAGIVTASVCKDSGKLPTDLCANDPRGSRVITDMFVEGTVPTESCDAHVKALVDSVTGKLANEYTPPGLAVEKIFIKRQFPAGDNVADYQYQVPAESDPVPGEAQYPSDGGQGQQPDGGEPATP